MDRADAAIDVASSSALWANRLMSVSLYRGQVDRLTKEIADLEKKAADERTRAAKERGDALRKSSSIGRGTSESTLRSKLREIQRHEENASRHERRAADYATQIARKQQSLTSSQKSLDRALADERRKEEQAAKRRRDEDVRHLRRIEDARQASQAPMMTTPFRPAVRLASKRRSPAAAPRDDAGFEYDACLSFAGEQRDYVEMIASGLKKRGLRVFYDADETVSLWGKDLAEHLDYIYRKASRYCVVFVSKAYAAKPWTRHERRSALARAIEEEGEYILPVRFDDTELPGLRPTVAYVDLRQYAPETLIEFVVEKITSAGR